MFSWTALTLPGSVTMSVFLMVPATGRESAASGVAWSEAFRTRWTIPGASRSSNGLIAYIQGAHNQFMSCTRADGGIQGLTSGVLSRTPKPVPPVVTIQSTSP